MNLLKIDNLYWICTQNHKFDNFSVNMHKKMYEKLCNFQTIHPGVVSLVLKYAQNSNENCHEIPRREHCAFRRYRTKSQGGG